MEYKDKVVIVTGGAQAAMTIDTTNLCSHLQKKLFEPEGVYSSMSISRAARNMM